MNKILSLISGVTPQETAQKIAGRVKSRRLELNLTQAAMAEKAGMKLPTYRLFERTGRISLKSLLMIGFALDCLEDFDELFVKRKYATLEEAMAGGKVMRKRGKRHD